MKRARVACAVTALIACAACVRKPVTAPRVIVPATEASEVNITGTQGKRFGDMIALGIGLSNGSPHTYDVSATRIYAVDENGNRIAPLGVQEAARQAGGAEALRAGLEGAGGGALLTGLLGAIPGALIGAAQDGAGGAARGAAVGTGIGVVVGAIGGFHQSKTATEEEIIEQLSGLYLGDRQLQTGVPVSGFVFYPRGSYAGVRAILIEQESKHVTEIAGSIIDNPD